MYNYVNYQTGNERVTTPNGMMNNQINLSTPEEGYNRGNIFADLYDPYKDYRPATLKANNEQSELYLEMSRYAFALHEMNLYLDLHPEDSSMLSLFNDYRERTNRLMMEYENKYGPLTISSDEMTNSFSWVKDEWPWAGGDM